MKRNLPFFGLVILAAVGFGFMFIQSASEPSYQVFFAYPGDANPGEDHPKDFLIDAISQLGANDQLLLAMHSFTDEDLAYAILDARAQGADVQIIVEEKKACAEGSVIAFLDQMFMPIVTDHSDGTFHHKFAVIGNTVITGSYNWTTASEQDNWENMIVIRDDDVADIYRDQFKKMWSSNDVVSFGSCQ